MLKEAQGGQGNIQLNLGKKRPGSHRGANCPCIQAFLEKKSLQLFSKMETGTKGQRGVLQATAERDAFMSDLPPELIRLILLGLWDGAKCIRSASAARRGIEDLLSASLTCKTWNIIIEEEWKALFLSHFSQTDLQICNELQAQSFWGRKPNRDSHLNPYDEIFSVRGDAERAKKEQLEAERNARITSVKHFFIMKVLDPLLVSISANKSILTPNTSTDFKVGIHHL